MMTNIFILQFRTSPRDGVLELTIDSFFGSDEGTYVCRTSNIAGQDADTISLTTRKSV